MRPTTYLRRREEQPRCLLESCHGGIGALDHRQVMGGMIGSTILFIHDNVLPPGASIGQHDHSADEEVYYILEGQGTMQLDGESVPVRAGDLTGILPGGTHGLINDGDDPLRLLVIGVQSTPETGE